MNKDSKKLYEDKRKKLFEIKPCHNCKYVFNLHIRKTVEQNNKDIKACKVCKKHLNWIKKYNLNEEKI